MLSLVLRLSKSLRSEATLLGFWFVPCRGPLPLAATPVSRLPLRRVGPTVRLTSKASTRKRFVLWLDVTFVISVTLRVLPVQTANRRNPLCRDRAKCTKMTQVVVVQQLTPNSGKSIEAFEADRSTQIDRAPSSL